MEKLILVDSAGLGPEINPTLLDLVHAEPTPEHIREELALFFTNPTLVQQALVELLYQQRTQPGAREALQATADAAFSAGQQRIDVREALTQLSQPVLVIWGAADAVIPAAHAQLAQQAQQGRLVVLANCGHCPHIERSDEFNQTVLAFLSE